MGVGGDVVPFFWVGKWEGFLFLLGMPYGKVR